MARDKALQFCIDILPAVSRTFALNIRVLKGELYRAVLCGYLFCRIVDTVEDSEALSVELRNKLLDEYAAMFAERDFCRERIINWISQCSEIDKSQNESSLITGSCFVFDVFASLPDSSQEGICDCVVEMTQGMKETTNRKLDPAEGVHTLKSQSDLDRYCYFVAGTVGKMLTRLFSLHSKNISLATTMKLQSLEVSFGLGLQMTNIIKDCYGDYQRGWCYVPTDLLDHEGVRVSSLLSSETRRGAIVVLNGLTIQAAKHLDDALAYTLTIPRRELRIRLFNLWSLILAIRTLNKAWNNEDLLSGEKKVKIERSSVYATLIQTSLRAFSNGLLKNYYWSFRRNIPESQ